MLEARECWLDRLKLIDIVPGLMLSVQKEYSPGQHSGAATH